MKISERGIEFIKRWEGCRLEVYKDTAGVSTIGYGHAYWTGSPKITQEVADMLLKDDLEKFEKKVMKYDPVYKFKQNEFDALVSFAYNIGSIKQLTADGKRSREEIILKMPEYKKSGGKVIQGLIDRRLEEVEIFKNGYSDVSRETLKEVADRVIRGDFGNGEERRKNLEKAGFNYEDVQAIVNLILKPCDYRETLESIADRVIRGDFGNGEERRRLLEEQGYNYKAVQYIVNEKLK